MEKEAFEVAASAVASKSTYGGAATSFLGWLLSSEFTIIVGLLAAVGGFVVNWYYKAKADRRTAEADRREAEASVRAEARARVEHEARMVRLRLGESSDTDQGELR